MELCWCVVVWVCVGFGWGCLWFTWGWLVTGSGLLGVGLELTWVALGLARGWLGLTLGLPWVACAPWAAEEYPAHPRLSVMLRESVGSAPAFD